MALKVGAIVYLVDTTEKKADDMYWSHIRTDKKYRKQNRKLTELKIIDCIYWIEL